MDKFRFNAKRASLVQSRIKAIEREDVWLYDRSYNCCNVTQVVEAVEEDVGFKFSFTDCGQLGRPVIQIEGVTFGYGAPVNFSGSGYDILMMYY